MTGKTIRHVALAAVIAAALLPDSVRAGDAWEMRISPYIWGTGLSGDTRLGPAEGGVDASFSDILDNLDIAGMVFVEGQNGPWGISADVFYARLGKTGELAVGLEPNHVNGKLENTIIHLGGSYRLSDTGTGHLDLIGGIRYTDVDVRLTVGPSPLLPDGARRSGSKDWVDGFIGIRGSGQVADQWQLFGRLDVGAGGTDLSWQAIAGASYVLESGNSIDFGYRYLSQDYESSDFVYDIQMGGAFVGMSFVF